MKPLILIPFHKDEAMPVSNAAKHAGLAVRTIRWWCERGLIGRKVGGRWNVSRVALQMKLEGDDAALAAYRHGNRSSDAVQNYYRRTNTGHVLTTPAFYGVAK